MPNDNEPISILIDFGLSALQAKIYLALLTQELNTAQTISDHTKVSRPDVYRVTTELEKLQLAERIVSKPNRFQAVPLKVCTDILIQKREKELAEAKKRIPSLIKQIGEKTFDKQIDTQNEFTIITKETFHIRSRKMINEAKKSIHSVIPTDKVVLPPDEYRAILDKTLTRKIEVKAIIGYPQKEKLINMAHKRPSLFKNYQVKFIKDEPLIAMGIFDKEKVVINTKPQENFDSNALFSCNKSIVSLCESYFQNLWEKGFF